MPSIYKGLLPPNAGAFDLIEQEDLDRLLDGMDLNAETVVDFLATLADLRDPDLTPILEDLEREYGFLFNPNLTEDERRAQLAALVYASTINGSKDDLEGALTRAGFNVKVYQNDPPVDPANFFGDEYLMEAGGVAAYAGEPSAVAGLGGGDILLSARNDPYILPDDPNRWPYVFFIAGDRNGGAALRDPFMEQFGTAFYNPSGSAAVEKDPSIKNSGTQSLKVIAADVERTVLEMLQPDPSLLAAYDMESQTINENANQVPNLAWFNRVSDGSMEKQGVADWTIGNATGVKTQVNPYSGNQCLELTASGTSNFYAYQSVTPNGKVFQAIGHARGDGNANPYLVNNNRTLWLGTSSTDYQECDELFISENLNTLFAGTNAAAGRKVFWDACGLYAWDNKIIDDCSSVSGAVTVDSNDFSYLNSTPSKQTNNVLRLSLTAASGRAVLPFNLVPGRNYRFVGEHRSDGSGGQSYIFDRTNDQLLSPLNTTNSWQKEDYTFTAGATAGALEFFGNISGQYVEFRNLILIDLDEGASTHSDPYTQQLVNGDCESATGWTSYGSPDLFGTYSTVVYKGSNSLRTVLTAGGSLIGMYQTSMTIGKRYRVRAHGNNRSSGGTVGIYDGNPNTTGVLLKSETTSDEFAAFDEEFTAASTDLYFVGYHPNNFTILWDDILLEELDENNTDATNTNGTNTVIQGGNAINFNGTDAEVQANDNVVSPFGYQTHSIGAWIVARSTGTPAVQGLITNGDFSNTAAQYMASFIAGGNLVSCTFSDGTAKNSLNLGPFNDYSLMLVSMSRIYDGSDTILELCLNGVLIDSFIFVGDAPDVSVTDFLIGYLNSTYYFDGLIAHVQAYNEPKDAAFWAAQVERVLATADTGAYTDATLTETLGEEQPLTGAAWSDASAAPVVEVRDEGTGLYTPAWMGNSSNTNKQTMSGVIPAGTDNVRLRVEDAAGSVNFDDIDITNISFERASVPANRRAQFEDLILKNKPLSTWAALFVDFV